MASEPSFTANSDINEISIAVGKALLDHAMTLSVAESCTGGLIGAAITAIAGSSSYFLGGIIAYDNEIKRGVLGVRSEALDTHGAVSKEVVVEMAKGAGRLIHTDCAIAVSGVAGPDGGTKAKPVGTVCIGISTPAGTKGYREQFKGNREQIRRQTVTRSLGLLLQALTER